MGKASKTEFYVRYVDRERRRVSDADRGRLFVWAKNPPVLLVDADETLSAESLDEHAQATLNKAAEQGWHLIYLALAGANAHEFRQASGWIERQGRLPMGPVLGRPQYAADVSLESARRASHANEKPIQGPDARRGQNDGGGPDVSRPRLADGSDR